MVRPPERTQRHYTGRYAEQLVKDGHAYAIPLTHAELEEMREHEQPEATWSPAYDHITRQYAKNKPVTESG